MSGPDVDDRGPTDFLALWRMQARAKMRADYMRATAAAESCKSLQEGKPTRYAAALLQIGKDYLAASQCFEDKP